MTQTQPKIYGAMAKILSEVNAIAKDKKNAQQGFQYRGIDDVYNSLNPVLAKHGVFMTSHIIDKTREERQSSKGGVLAFTCLRMQYTFWADDGSSVSTEVEGEGMDSGDKSSNKAMAVAHKYALLQAFCIPTQGIDDPDAEVHEVGGEPKQQTRQRAPKQTEEPPAVTEAKAILAQAQKVKPDEWEAFFDGLQPRLDDIKKASANTYNYVMEQLGQIEANMKVAA